MTYGSGIKTLPLPCIIFDHNKYDVVPNNLKKNDSNNKITDMVVDYQSNPWRLKLSTVIDGREYIKYIPLTS